MPTELTRIRAAIIAVGRKLAQRGLVVATDGNISARLSRSEILITRRGSVKGELAARDVIRWKVEESPAPGARVSSEYRLHREVYRRRPNAGAVIHAHPPCAVALSLAGLVIADDMLPEVLMLLGAIPTAAFAPPGSEAGAKAVGRLAARHDAIILDRHGSLTIGRTLTEAWHNLERLEFTACVTLLAHSVGAPRRLTDKQKKQLLTAAAGYRSLTTPGSR